MTVTDDLQEIAPARQAINEMVDAGLLDHLMSKVDDGLVFIYLDALVVKVHRRPPGA